MSAINSEKNKAQLCLNSDLFRYDFIEALNHWEIVSWIHGTRDGARSGRTSISTVRRNSPATACGSPTVCCIQVPMTSKVDWRTRAVACSASATERRAFRTIPLRDQSPVCREFASRTMDASVVGSYYNRAVGSCRNQRRQRSRRREQRRGTRQSGRRRGPTEQEV